MAGLTSRTCTPCRGGIPPLTAEQASAYLPEVSSWELAENATRIRRTFRFTDYASTVRFVRKITDLAESEGHHPVITFGWGFCTVDLQTKKIKGLHENDFIMAAKIDALAA